MKLIECVPNISEGQNEDIINQIIDPLRQNTNIHLLDVDSGFDTNRTVITFIGEPEHVVHAAFNLIKKASILIDMSKHKGKHPRMGATDVCPLIPIQNITINECVTYSKNLAKKVSKELNIPTYLYEFSSKLNFRNNLADIRKGEYEGMFKKIKTKNWHPDFGKAENNITSGVTAIGVREFLIAYNINLNTSNKKIATDIALDIREAGRAKRDNKGNIIRDKNGKIIKVPGKLKYCKAVGWYIDEYKQAQVSINLTNYKKTSLYKTFEEVRSQARKRGVRVTGSEIVGLVPINALINTGIYYLGKQKSSTTLPQNEIIVIAIKSLGLSDIEKFDMNNKIIEFNLSIKNKTFTNMTIKDFINTTSLGTPTPGGGSISALCGSLSMALASMVTNLTFQKKGYESNHKQLNQIGKLFQAYKDRMLELIDLDSESYDKVIDAIRLPKKTDSDIKKRNTSINNATISATNIPLEILELSIKAMKQLIKIATIGNPNSISDIGVALHAIHTCAKGASMNVTINAKELNDTLKNKYLDQVDYYNKEADDLFVKIQAIVESKLK